MIPCPDPEPPFDYDDPLDDTWWWPGAVELEHAPEDLIECDCCKGLRDCVLIERPGCNVFLCSDCLPEYVDAQVPPARGYSGQDAG